MTDIAKLILRLMFGGLMLFHGVTKLSGAALDKIGGSLVAIGLPKFIAYGVLVGEILAPALLIIGLFTRPAALILAFNMVVAVLLAHRGDVFSLSPHGAYALELQAMYFFGGIAIFLLGPGVFSVTRGRGPLD